MYDVINELEIGIITGSFDIWRLVSNFIDDVLGNMMELMCLCSAWTASIERVYG